jgi:hypothetical protein
MTTKERLCEAVTKKDNAGAAAAALWEQEGNSDRYRAAVDDFGKAAEMVRRARVAMTRDA